MYYMWINKNLVHQVGDQIKVFHACLFYELCPSKNILKKKTALQKLDVFLLSAEMVTRHILRVAQ